MKEIYYYNAGKRYCNIVILFICFIIACCLLAGCRGKDTLFLDENGELLDEASDKSDGETNGFESMYELSDDVSGEINDTQTEYIMVYICGSVCEPGVYELEDGSRIIDAVIAAGGMTDAADAYYVNQAQLLKDGQRIYIPTPLEVENGELMQDGDNNLEIRNNSSSSDFAVNINSAGLTELMTLPGIGEVKAQSIIDYRNSNGNFKSTSDIMQVPGVKSGMYEKIKDKITISF